MAISIVRSHRLPQPEARALAEQIANELADEFGLRWRWQNDRLRFEHLAVRGWLEAAEQQVRLELRLSLAASLFATSLEQHIHQRLDQLLPAG